MIDTDRLINRFIKMWFELIDKEDFDYIQIRRSDSCTKYFLVRKPDYKSECAVILYDNYDFLEFIYLQPDKEWKNTQGLYFTNERKLREWLRKQTKGMVEK